VCYIKEKRGVWVGGGAATSSNGIMIFQFCPYEMVKAILVLFYYWN
jgi:hypothetical protein